MKKPKPRTEDEMHDLIAKAEGMFGTLTGLTSSPQEAAEIICMMHMLLFMNYGTEGSLDTMLERYVENFRENYAMQTEGSGRLN